MYDAGMSFGLGEDIEALRESVRRFATDRIAPQAALWLSFRANLTNIGAMLIYGLLLIVLALLASIPLGLGWFVLGPMMAGSWYATWRDVFGEVAENRHSP